MEKVEGGLQIIVLIEGTIHLGLCQTLLALILPHPLAVFTITYYYYCMHPDLLQVSPISNFLTSSHPLFLPFSFSPFRLVISSFGREKSRQISESYDGLPHSTLYPNFKASTLSSDLERGSFRSTHSLGL